MTEKDECDPSKKRRRRTVLTIDEKVDILQLFEASSLTAIAWKYNVGRSTISDIRRNKEKILLYKKDMVEMGMSRPAKVMRVADDSELDKAVYVWFQQKRMEGMPITGAMLCEKAVWFNKKMNGEDTKFTASSGWQRRFCGRHGIRGLSV